MGWEVGRLEGGWYERAMATDSTHGSGPSEGLPRTLHWISEPTVDVRLPEGLTITTGPVPEGPVDILIGGRPDREALALATQALVIPYAGLPRRTRRFLLERPELPVYALHHNAEAVAELAVALLLATARQIIPMDRALRAHDWRGRYAPDPSVELRGGRCVLLGLGAINGRVAPVVEALGMQVVALRSGTPTSEADAALSGARALVCAVPSTPETRGWMDARRLALLPDQTVVVNVGRADLFEEDAFFAELARGRLRAGLDVWWRYPDTPQTPTAPSAHPFETLDQVVLSPHRAGHGEHVERARSAHLQRVIEALLRGGEPPGRVDVVRGY